MHIDPLRKRVTRDTSQVETCVGGLKDAPTLVRCLMIDASANSKLRKKTCSVFERVSQLSNLSAFFKGFRRLAKAEIRDFTRDRSAIKLSFNKQHSLVSAWRYTDRRDTLCYTLPGLLISCQCCPCMLSRIIVWSYFFNAFAISTAYTHLKTWETNLLNSNYSGETNYTARFSKNANNPSRLRK